MAGDAATVGHECHESDTNTAKHGDGAPSLQYDGMRCGGQGYGCTAGSGQTGGGRAPKG